MTSDECYGIQIQRCDATGEFIQFISKAEGSLAEADTQLILSIELGFCPKVDVTSAFDLIVELQRMLNALRRKLIARK